MNQDLIHVYLMPGLAASSSIFENLKLEPSKYQTHLLDWIIPEKNEKLEDYARRMADEVKHHNVVLIGVSFGGVLVQEMKQFVKPRKVIIISSVKCKHELPRRMKLARKTLAYKILPTQLVSRMDLLAKYAFGKTISKRIELYKKYLAMNNKQYLDWAIKNAVCWGRDETDTEIIHIHGDKDMVFPISNIKDCIVVKGGTHIMIINRFKWFNERLPELISS